MTTERLIAGVDVSKERLDITMFDGEVSNSFDIPYTQASFNEIISRYTVGSVHVICEATGNYHRRLSKFNQELGVRFTSLNPFIIKRYSDVTMKRAKTDRMDSKLIAEYGYKYSPPINPVVSELREKMKQLLKAVEDLHQTELDYHNRLEAHLIRPDGVPEVEAAHRDIINIAATKRKELEKELLAITKSQYRESFQLLTSIPGIGPIGAAVIIAFFGQFESFENSKQVISYIGTNPTIVQSGKHSGKSGISHRGNSYIRKKLYMCAISASQHNPQCVLLYDRLRERGMAKRPAFVAVMNKLIRQAFGVLKSKTPYSPTM